MGCPHIRAFDFLLKEKRDLVGVEIGVLAGSHALSMLELLDIKTLYLVDPYFLYKSKYESGELEWNNEKWEKVAKEKLKNYKDKIIWINTTSVKAVVHFEDESLDFVYIDANHEYKFVLEDIELWTPKVKQSGVVGGHDHVPAHPGVAKAIKAYSKKNKIDYKTKHFVNKAVNMDWAFRRDGKIIENWDIPKGNRIPKTGVFKQI